MLKKAVIIDLDGTLVDNQYRVVMYAAMTQSTRDTLDWDKEVMATLNDPAAEWCVELVNSLYQQDVEIIFLTGRTGTQISEMATRDWLMMHLPMINYQLLMRQPGDFRPDYLVKQDIFMTKVSSLFNVLFAVDDQRRIVDMFNGIGVRCLHCSDY